MAGQETTTADTEIQWRTPRVDGSDEPREGVDADPDIPILEYLNVRISREVDLEDATSHVEMDLREDLRNMAGVLQGGMVATVLDVAAGVCASRASGSRHVLTQDLDIRYLRGVKVGPARATATVMRAGKRSVVIAVELRDMGAEDPEEICSFATCTLAVVGPRNRRPGK